MRSSALQTRIWHIAVTLKRITEASVELIDSVHYADVLMISRHGDYRSVAATAQLAMVVDSAQQRLHQGSSIDAANNDTVVVCNDLQQDRRWPSFAALAVAAGSLGDVLTSQSVAIELARSAVGGIALALSVPLTTAIAAVLATPGHAPHHTGAVRADTNISASG